MTVLSACAARSTAAEPQPQGASRIQPAQGVSRDAKPVAGLDDSDLEAAIADAKAARAAGKLKPAATTPEQYARALGAINYRIFEMGVVYPEPPAAGSDKRVDYDAKLAQLTSDLANLLSDEELAERSGDESPEALAHNQAWLAAGTLDLDEATTAKVEAIIAKGYADALPAEVSDPITPEQDAELEKNLEAMNKKVEEQIAKLLTPIQKARLDALGIEQVLFGLFPTEE